MIPVQKALLAAAGFASLSAGVIGIFLPVLTTTRLYCWLTGHRVFRSYIDAWCRHHAVTKKSKAISIVILWAVMLCTIAFAAHALWLRLVLEGVALAVTAHLLLLKTLTAEMPAQTKIPAAGHHRLAAFLRFIRF